MSLLRYQHSTTWLDRTVTLLAFFLGLGVASFFSYLQMPIMTAIMMFVALGGALAHEDSKRLTLASVALWLLFALSFLGLSSLAMAAVRLAGVAT